MIEQIIVKTVEIAINIDELLGELRSGLTTDEIALVERMQKSVRPLLRSIDARLLEAHHNM